MNPQKCSTCGSPIHPQAHICEPDDRVYCSTECYKLRLTEALVNLKNNQTTNPGISGFARYDITDTNSRGSSQVKLSPWPSGYRGQLSGKASGLGAGNDGGGNS